MKKSILFGLPLAAILICSPLYAQKLGNLIEPLHDLDRVIVYLETPKPNKLSAYIVTTNDFVCRGIMSTVEITPDKATVSMDITSRGKTSHYDFEANKKWEVFQKKKKLNPDSYTAQFVMALVEETFREAGHEIQYGARKHTPFFPDPAKRMHNCALAP